MALVPEYPSPKEVRTPRWWSKQRFLLQSPKIGGLIWRAARNTPAGTGNPAEAAPARRAPSIIEFIYFRLRTVASAGSEITSLDALLIESRREISGEMGTETREKEGEFHIK